MCSALLIFHLADFFWDVSSFYLLGLISFSLTMPISVCSKWVFKWSKFYIFPNRNPFFRRCLLRVDTIPKYLQKKKILVVLQNSQEKSKCWSLFLQVSEGLWIWISAPWVILQPLPKWNLLGDYFGDVSKSTGIKSLILW